MCSMVSILLRTSLVNTIFYNGLVAHHIFSGLFLFLEEDHYVSEDFLHVLKLMDSEKKKSFPKVLFSDKVYCFLKQYFKVDILCLGTYLKKFNFRSTGQQVNFTFNNNPFFIFLAAKQQLYILESSLTD